MKTQTANYSIEKVKSFWILTMDGISKDCEKWYRKRDALKYVKSLN